MIYSVKSYAFLKKLFLILSWVFSLVLGACSGNQELMFEYPYKDLKKTLQKKNNSSIKIFAYGSLMNPLSSKETLTHSDQLQNRAALAFGLQRVFNLDVPIIGSSEETYTAMLNVQKTHDPSSFINGVLIDVSIEDIDALAQREEHYDLMAVDIVLWDHFLQGNLVYQKAYVLIRTKHMNPRKDLLPNPTYLKNIEESIQSYGPCFVEIWQNTTYLADGKTSLKTYKNQPQNPRDDL